MESIIEKVYVFQTDSEIVRDVYNNSLNYLIEYDQSCTEKVCCAIYFSSNNIYFPNSEQVFNEKIVRKNFFEWYGTRVKKAYKHIFVRDVFKQWYLSGINRELNSTERLFDFLKKETEGFNIILTGSSAGAYAAILFGSLLKAEKIIAFNPQFQIMSLLGRSSEATDPLVFRLKNSPATKYYDIVPFISPASDIFYFYSNKSPWDIEQNNWIRDLKDIHRIEFRSSHHGIPFLKVALPRVINMEDEKMKRLENNRHSPVIFTIKIVGLRKTILGFFEQFYNAYKRRK